MMYIIMSIIISPLLSNKTRNSTQEYGIYLGTLDIADIPAQNAIFYFGLCIVNGNSGLAVSKLLYIYI